MSKTDTVDQVLERVQLDELLIDINVRTDVKLDKDFIASIKAHGILQPPIGWRGEDGKVRITAGQRRTLAAIQLELGSIDVILKPQAIAEAARIVTQLAENDQRQELTTSERVHGYKQLAMFGVSPEQIARRTNKPKAQVVVALGVAESAIAVEALDSLPITLEQAAIIAEFEDDAEAIDRLMQVASSYPTNLAHEAQRLRDDREYRAAKAEKERELAATGIEVIFEAPAYNDSSILSLSALWRTGDATRTTPEADPQVIRGLVARVHQAGYYARENGDVVGVTYYVRDWASQGLETFSHSTPKSEADVAKEKEQKKAERQQAADLRSATKVRREWIRTDLLQRPAGRRGSEAAKLIAAALVGADTSASDGRVYPIAAELLGIEYSEPAKGTYDNRSRTAVVEALRAGADPMRLALGVAIARTESVIGDPAGWVQSRDSAITVAYYLQLEEWGYTLSDVERAIAYPKKRRGAKR
ncbi:MULTISPECIES: ParB/RepB/Spo0J family partition protein [unclassified Microbacterium]|uniref:ParB/RepB/Spo0J family partition protein n=1 Tax=unclassified Microbacterium TaxID=2609290 RepID=UPI003C2BD781